MAHEQFEFVDIRPENELRESWKQFIHTHHYEAVRSFADSWIANHPRRTVEAFYNQYGDGQLIENNPLPLPGSFQELWSWFAPLSEAESSAVE
jgi:hypothetical protein